MKGLVFLALLFGSLHADNSLHRKIIGTRTYEGIEVELAIEPVGHGQSLELRAGQTVRFLFSIRDTTTSQPVSGLFPAAWVQSRPKGVKETPDYQKIIQTFIGGGLLSQPDTDLNVYHVLTLNDDQTISVVDPLFGFGGSKLLTMISLPEPGHDWARMTRASKLFVSLPESNQIALVDTASWQVATLMPQVNHPTKLALQPDEHFLWASLPDGVAVFKTAPFSFQYLFQTEATAGGSHDFAFTQDNRFAFISHSQSQELTIVDLATFKLTKKLTLSSPVSSIAYDPTSEAIYLTHADSGKITCVDAVTQEIHSTLTSEPGLGQLRFAPKGRWGFLVNPATNRLSILDSARNRIVQSGLVDEAPNEISFSDNFAYIRHRKSPNLLLVPLDGKNLGLEGTQIPTVEAPAGDSSYGEEIRPTPASTIVQAPGANAVLIANPDDKAIYFYKEGMAAPMGQFNNYGQKPRAVSVVDRSLREKSRQGVYETIGRLEKAGTSDVVFFTDSPRMSLGFPIEVGEALLDESAPRIIEATPLSPSSATQAGKPLTLQFQLNSSTPLPLQAHTFMTGGSWQNRQKVVSDQDGLATITFTPPTPGFYQIRLRSTSPQHTIKQSQRAIFEIKH